MDSANKLTLWTIIVVV
jgi:hypothetical protein